MKKLINLSIIFYLVIQFGATAQYELVWSDEFDYTGSPDDTKWNYDIGDGCPNVCGWGNNELQYYTDRIENVFVEDGILTIKAIKEDFGGKQYTSTRLISKEKGDWLYGRIEVRALLPSGRGTWPAIWMLPTDWEYGGWPDSGEIDIMEHVGYDPLSIHGTVHTKAYNHSIGTQKGNHISVSDCETEFHVYSIEWLRNRIDFYVDDKVYFSFEREFGFERWPFDKRFHLLMNIAVGGNWGGAEGVDENIWPQEMKIDYVRVYQNILHTGSLSNELKIYPNPNQSKFRVTLPDHIDKPQFDLTNILGQAVSFDLKQINQNEFEIHIKELVAGCYLLSCRRDGILISSERVRIQ